MAQGYQFLKRLKAGEDLGTPYTGVDGRFATAALSSGGNMMYNPCMLTDELKTNIEAPGGLKLIVALFIFHSLTIRAWVGAFPGAKLLVCPGMKLKLPGQDPTSPIREAKSIA
jgi:hypothetical protein